MSITSDLQSILSGVRKGKRDIKKIKAHLAEHQKRHAAGEDFDCDCDNKEFWRTLGNDLNDTDPFEKAAYRKAVAGFQEQVIREKTEELGLKVICIELDGDESEEIVHDRINRAIEDSDAFEALVSETNYNNDQKGGK